MADTRRIEAGRGHWYKLDGDKVDGVTKILGDGVPKPALVNWAGNITASYAVDNWADLSEKKPSERLEILKKSRWAERDEAANKGTLVHGFAERIARGEEVDVPDYLIGHVDSYIAFLDDFDPTIELLEVTVVSRRYRYMGTLDMICTIDGDRWLIDIKTSRSGIFKETALQLAAYGHAESYIGPDNEEHPMPQVDRYAGLWVRSDGYDLIPTDSGDLTFRQFLYIQQTARFLNRDDIIGAAIQPSARRAS